MLKIGQFAYIDFTSFSYNDFFMIFLIGLCKIRIKLGILGTHLRFDNYFSCSKWEVSNKRWKLLRCQHHIFQIDQCKPFFTYFLLSWLVSTILTDTYNLWINTGFISPYLNCTYKPRLPNFGCKKLSWISLKNVMLASKQLPTFITYLPHRTGKVTIKSEMST